MKNCDFNLPPDLRDAPEYTQQMMIRMHRMKHIHFWECFPGDLTRSETMVLGCLCHPARSQDGLPASELSKRIHVQPAGISRLLNSMEEKGLLVRKIDPKNRRSILVMATEKGRSLFREGREAGKNYWQAVFENVSREDFAELLRIWDDIMNRMEKVLAQQKGETDQ